MVSAFISRNPPKTMHRLVVVDVLRHSGGLEEPRERGLLVLGDGPAHAAGRRRALPAQEDGHLEPVAIRRHARLGHPCVHDPTVCRCEDLVRVSRPAVDPSVGVSEEGGHRQGHSRQSEAQPWPARSGSDKCRNGCDPDCREAGRVDDGTFSRGQPDPPDLGAVGARRRMCLTSLG